MDNLPGTVDRIWEIRESLEGHYLKHQKPYGGELGIESYAPWQIDDYWMVRKIVEDFLDDFCVRQIPSDFSVYERSMQQEMLRQQEKENQTQAMVLAERKAIRLLSEEIMLEVI